MSTKLNSCALLRCYNIGTKWMNPWDLLHSTSQTVCCFTWMGWTLYRLIGTNFRLFLDRWMNSRHFSWMQNWLLCHQTTFPPLRNLWWSSNPYVHFYKDVRRTKLMMSAYSWYSLSWGDSIIFYLLLSTPPWMPLETDIGCLHLRHTVTGWLRNMPRFNMWMLLVLAKHWLPKILRGNKRRKVK